MLTFCAETDIISSRTGGAFMARHQREKSETGIYHVMLCGINKFQVFFDDEDYYMFLNILSHVKTVSGFKLYAYCLMNNHVHLLIEEGNEPLSLALKRIGNSFIYQYNIKYNRTGGIFQGRFKSKPVNDDEYFISVLRYIHRNPVKAGIVNSCSEYVYSSYNEYFKSNSFVNTGFAIEMIGIDEFVKMHSQPGIDTYLDIDNNQRLRLTDSDAKKVFTEISFCESAMDFDKYPKDMQKVYIKRLRKSGLTIKQISEFTGLTYRQVQVIGF